MNKKWLVPGISVGLAILAIITAGFVIARDKRGADFPLTYVTAVKQDLKNEVNTDGIIKPAEAVDLGFEMSGKISKIQVKVGQKVKAGSTIATISSADLAAGTNLAQANVANALAHLAQVQAIVDGQNASTATGADSAEHVLADALTAQSLAKESAHTSLVSKQVALLSSAQVAVNSNREAILLVTDIQDAYFGAYDPDSIRVADAKAIAVQNMYNQSNAGHWNRASIAGLQGGIFETISHTTAESVSSDFSVTARALIIAMNSTSTALNAIPQSNLMSSVQFAQISSMSASLRQSSSALSAAITAVDSQVALNDAALATASAAVTAAQNNVNASQNQVVTNSPANSAQEANANRAKADLASARAGVAQARASLAAASAQYAKASLKAPIDGVITAVPGKVGQFTSPGAPVISLMSNGAMQVEAYVAQTDIVHLSAGAAANIKVDGDSEHSYDAVILTVDPAATLNNGVQAYRIVLQINSENDLLKAGMHANIHIETDVRPAAILIPESAVIHHDNQSFVFLKNDRNTEHAVQVGASSKGMIEVIDGVNEGDAIAVFGGK